MSSRLLIDLPAAGAWNMAVDEMLLDAAARNGMALRFYGWAEPTVSLGYFQDFADRFSHATSRFCPVVRRLTGGGTILHDRELTYSLVLPQSHPLATDRDRLYAVMHNALVAALNDYWSLAAKVFCPCAAGEAHDAEFLCFQRRTPGDVVLGGMKIAGSAQRRRRGAVLQHGSVLLARSTAAPELPGLFELTGIEISADELIAAWLPRLRQSLCNDFRDQPLDHGERQQAEQLVRRRYAAASWTEHRER